MIGSYFDKPSLLSHGRKAVSALKSLGKKTKNVKLNFIVTGNNFCG